MKNSEEFLKNEPNAKNYILSLISARELLNGKFRWCLWLEDISPKELKNNANSYGKS